MCTYHGPLWIYSSPHIVHPLLPWSISDLSPVAGCSLPLQSPSELRVHLSSCTNPPWRCARVYAQEQAPPPPPRASLPKPWVSVSCSPLGSTRCQGLQKRQVCVRWLYQAVWLQSREGLRTAVLSCPQNPGLVENKEAQSTSQYVLSNNFFVFNIN